MKKRIISVILAFALMATSLLMGDIGVRAADNDAKKLENAILKVKNTLSIGDEYSEFDYNQREDRSGEVMYEFDWRTKTGDSHISVCCYQDGSMVSFDKYGEDTISTVPKYTKDELKEKASAALMKLNKVVYENSEFADAYTSSYNSSYAFSFIRSRDGVRLNDDRAVVYINYTTSELVSFYVDWNKSITLPSTEGAMSYEEAKRLLENKIKLSLMYHVVTDENGENKVFLAYSPTEYYYSMDAKTGEFYEDSVSSKRSNADMEEKAINSEASMDEGASLSDAEKAKIEDVKGVYSKSEIIKKLKSYKDLYFDKSLGNTRAYLYHYSNGKYIWTVIMEDTRPYKDGEDNYRGYSYATLDGKTGKLLRYEARIRDYSDYSKKEQKTIKEKYTKKECKEIFNKFVKAHEGKKFSLTKLGSCEKTHPIRYDEKNEKVKYAGYSICLSRYHDGIMVCNNDIRGSVDSITGKIYSYALNWNEGLRFIDTANVISKKEAVSKFVDYSEFGVCFESAIEYITNKDNSYDVRNYARLVYMPQKMVSLIDAFNGKELRYDGSEVVEDKHSQYEYKDIEGSSYEKAIKLMASMGIGFEGDMFYPDKAITTDELMEFAKKIPGLDSWNKLLDSKASITREEAAYYLVRCLNLERLASLNIFKTGYLDEASIKEDYKGAVAILKGYGVMGAKRSSLFCPKDDLTRAEAMDILLNLFSFNM